ncbi:MAG: RdgB/HAM1 family non-canonical purine NTP pyrophosphatase [Candidatus Omnitrophota bacterium]
MFEIVISSRNRDKKRELKALLKGLKVNPVRDNHRLKSAAFSNGVKVLDLNDFPSAPRVEEKADTFEENAAEKALKIARFTKKFTLADDSGLVVEALGGRPGARSARFTGEKANDEKNNRKLLKLLQGVALSDRKAKFVCVIALADKDGVVGVVRGECAGRIALAPRGKNGFGYDPVFIGRGHSKTFAELGARTKNLISHRAKALKKARALIQRLLLKACL